MDSVIKHLHFQQQGNAYTPLLILLTMLSIFVAGSWYAFSQSPRPTPYTPATLADNFLYPIESNAFERLPKISQNLNNVFALPDSRLIWVVGDDGLIIHSPDGGVTWQQQTFPDNNQRHKSEQAEQGFEQQNLLEFFVSNAKAEKASTYTKPVSSRINPDEQKKQDVLKKKLAAEAEQKIIKTRQLNSGDEQTIQSVIKQNKTLEENTRTQIQEEKKTDLFAVFFIDASHGVIVGDQGLILHTENGGAHWKKQHSGTNKMLLNITAIPDSEHWVAVGERGALVISDNGINWEVKSSETRESLKSIAVTPDGKRWIAVGNRGAMVSSGNGIDWEAKSLGIDGLFNSIAVTPDGKHWVAVGEMGTIVSSDNGIDWETKSSGTRESLRSITATPDGKHWVAVGDQGTLLSFGDGIDLEIESRLINARLTSVVATPDGKRLIAVGSRGALFSSENGIDWEAKSIRTTEWLRSIAVTPDGKRWVAAGVRGTLISSANGVDWEVRSSGTSEWLYSIAVLPDGKRWVVVGGRGTLISSDNGIDWEVKSSGINQWLRSIAVTSDGKRWVAVGDSGALVSSDNGIDWEAKSSGTLEFLGSIEVTPDGKRWVAIGADGALVTSANGIDWEAKSSGTSKSLRSIAVTPDGKRWVAVGEEGALVTSANGIDWKAKSSGTNKALRNIAVTPDGKRWVAVGDRGALVSSANGFDWEVKNSGTSRGLRSLAVTPDGKHWVAMGYNGTLVISENGIDWKVKNIGTNEMFRRLAVTPDGKRWVAVGLAGSLISSENGIDWNGLKYKRYPAGWYYMLCMIVLIVTWWALKSKFSQTDTQETIADLLASDRPLQTGDPDPLGFADIAQGLSRFIRNPRTEPPLTIAVTGEWGTGKSSLMNLLHEDLMEKGFSTVWFNAWHHQKSEQLLATLFANIRRQAIPGWLRFSGLRPVGLLFRLRLLLRRSKRHWLILLLMVFIFSVAMAFISEESGHFTQLINWLTIQLDESNRQLKIVFALGAAGATLLPLFIFIKSLQSFSLNPLKLMTIQSAEGQKASSSDPGARYQFACEFQDVTSSLDLGRMIIFIDDLDRCSKENVLEVLEAINFLVTSGNCYIILGMAREWVQICVGLGFKELATESFSNNHADTGIDPAEHRRKFARQYLEKMINIEVPVPVLDESKALKLTVPEIKPIKLSAFDSIYFKVRRFFTHNWPMLALLSLIAVGSYLGLIYELPEVKVPDKNKTQLEDLSVWPATDLEIVTTQGARVVILHKKEPSKATDPTTNADALEWVLKGDKEALEKGLLLHKFADINAELLLRKVKTPTKKVTPSPIVEEPKLPDEPITDDPKTPTAGFVPGAKNQIIWPDNIPYILIILVFITVLVLLLRKPDRIVEDSKPFREALKIWQEWLLLRKQTPRTIKRFLNHLRYMAMRYRNDEAPGNIWKRWKHKQESNKLQQTVFSEPSLVALSILYYIEPTWITDANKYLQINQLNFDELIKDIEFDKEADKTLREELLKKFIETIKVHKKTFKVEFLASEEQREHFLNAVSYQVT